MAYWNRQTQTFWALEQQKRRRARKEANTPSLRDQVVTALFGGGEQGALYDSSDGSTCFQDLAMTTPAGADDPVRVMLDLSSNDNHTIAPNDASRPIRKTDGTYWWLEFDGNDDWMGVLVDTGGETTYTAFLAANQFDTGFGYFYQLTDGVSEAASMSLRGGAKPGESGNLRLRGSGEKDIGFGDHITGDRVITALSNGASSELWYDGSIIDTGDAGAGSEITRIGLGHRYNQSGFDFVGRYYAAAFVFGEDKSSQRPQVESWLAGKSG